MLTICKRHVVCHMFCRQDKTNNNMNPVRAKQAPLPHIVCTDRYQTLIDTIMETKRLYIITFILAIAVLISCKNQTIVKSGFTDLKGPYLNQKVPSDSAEIFAPDLLSAGGPVIQINFSPNGKEFIYSLFTPERELLSEPKGIFGKKFVLKSNFENGSWTEPIEFSINENYDLGYRCYSTDGNKIYFNSNGPIDNQPYESRSHIWVSSRDGKHWSDPVEIILGDNAEGGGFPSVAHNGNLYFYKWPRGESHGSLFMSEYKQGKYLEPVRLSDVINNPGGAHPYIAPDESYIIFDSYELGQEEETGTDLFISFRDKNNKWMKPENLGQNVNSPYIERRPFVSSDGNYLFFASNRINPEISTKSISISSIRNQVDNPLNGYQNIFWVDASIIEDLRKNY